MVALKSDRTDIKIVKMKAEAVFNVAIHLSDYELQRLYNLITDKLNLKTKNLKKKPLLADEDVENFILKTVFNVKLSDK